mmetsp:Transcript_46774/g.83824  ORF Transcript_46774/g.83824 Transcript_46774/m.83824 type:complete len:126 (+) Transcript_46774:1409-1786(+)
MDRTDSTRKKCEDETLAHREDEDIMAAGTSMHAHTRAHADTRSSRPVCCTITHTHTRPPTHTHLCAWHTTPRHTQTHTGTDTYTTTLTDLAAKVYNGTHPHRNRGATGDGSPDNPEKEAGSERKK